MKNRLVLLVVREALSDTFHWAVVAVYNNIFRANKHYATISMSEKITGKIMFCWDMFYGVQIDRLDWGDMKCGSHIESINLPFDSIKSVERGQIYVEVYDAIIQYLKVDDANLPSSLAN